MKVLVACEYSGRVADAFINNGHDAWSCDLLECEGNNPHKHIKDNVLKYLNEDWDLVIAHPPCTFLSNSGVCWLHKDVGRWEKMRQGALFFKEIMESSCKKIAIENPVMHKYAVEIIGRRQDQVIQPWMFGHGETKATCLWLKGLPKLEPTDIVEGREQRLHKLPPSKDRAKLRSLTYQGIADAMASQWGAND